MKLGILLGATVSCAGRGECALCGDDASLVVGERFRGNAEDGLSDQQKVREVEILDALPDYSASFSRMRW